MTPLPIGFWSRYEAPTFDLSSIDDWATAGITLTPSPIYDGGDPEQVARMRTILDAAWDRGIRLIPWDKRLVYLALYRGKDEAAYRSDFEAALRDFGDHPGVFGFFAGDEPWAVSFDAACRAVSIQGEMAPHLTAFLNHHPWHEALPEWVGFEFKTRAEMVDAFMAGSGARLLSFDVYSQMKPGREGWDMYFENLNGYQAAARRYGVDCWVVLLCTGHYQYRCPNLDEIRWQVSTALAHGMRGLLWFLFYQGRPLGNFRGSPIDSCGIKTERYAWVAGVCRELLSTVAPTIMDLTLEKVMHLGRAFGGTAAFEPDELVVKAAGWPPCDLIVSRFSRRDGGTYLMVVNNDMQLNTEAYLTVRGRRPDLIHVGQELGVCEVERAVQRTDVEATAQHWLAPGQMVLYRVAMDAH